ncbi:hypothetical protein KBB96_08850 [Luteolibacter ambystomatis]|uniref:Uncharacterized protein n=1 Tax=Luteolibacter ambystomatis TaxID=2824561 RepID=A0A975J2S6_9BACT|nr:hypothetical protein [Luteolibacter ambystomatis]QUE52985.1 hypothetical protein KBB96_08850 [Luteolibacter ambystomatis]
MRLPNKAGKCSLITHTGHCNTPKDVWDHPADIRAQATVPESAGPRFLSDREAGKPGQWQPLVRCGIQVLVVRGKKRLLKHELDFTPRSLPRRATRKRGTSTGNPGVEKRAKSVGSGASDGPIGRLSAAINSAWR